LPQAVLGGQLRGGLGGESGLDPSGEVALVAGLWTDDGRRDLIDLPLECEAPPQSSLQQAPPSSPSSAGCPSPAIRPVRALRREPVACRLPTELASRWRGACGLTTCWGRWKRPFDFPLLTCRGGELPQARQLIKGDYT
jgi:hypothetical protein